ncbi:MAG TPA: gas vesicle protein GvpJ [Terriglobales bacterium]|nr:gas vesicle protein GvpJ [Terriglobales bacterium]
MDDSFIDVLDRVLTKGIVIDGWHKYFLGGVDLGHIASRFVVASLSTYLDRAEVLGLLSTTALPTFSTVQTKRQVRTRRRVRITRRVS